MTHHDIHHHCMPAASPAMTHGHNHSMPVASPVMTHGHHHHNNHHHGHQQAALPVFPVAYPYYPAPMTSQPLSVVPTTARAPAVEPGTDDSMPPITHRHHPHHHHDQQPAELPGFLVAHPWPYYPPSTTRQPPSVLPTTTTAVAPVVKPRADAGVCCITFTIFCLIAIAVVLAVIMFA